MHPLLEQQLHSAAASVDVAPDSAERWRSFLDAVGAAYDCADANGRFVSHLSHEIRTPLTAVLGMIDLLSHTDLSTEQREYVENVRRWGSVLLALAQDVLDFERAGSEAVPIVCEPFDLRALLAELEALLGVRATQRGLRLSVDCVPHLPSAVVGDRARLRQVLINLVDNALTYTDAGEVSVRVTAVRGGRDVRLEVRDTGVGMSPEALQTVFDAFSGPRTRQGVGLGLAICRRLVQRMGGRIEAQSAEGVGSTFRVELPLLDPAGAVEPIAVEWVPPAATRVLVVDDDAVSRTVLLAMLERLGFSGCEVAASGREALELAGGGQLGLVLLDCDLPGMDGFETARALRAGGCEAVIVAVTGLWGLDVRSRCVEAGMDEVLVKPLDVGRLRARLAVLLG